MQILNNATSETCSSPKQSSSQQPGEYSHPSQEHMSGQLSIIEYLPGAGIGLGIDAIIQSKDNIPQMTANEQNQIRISPWKTRNAQAIPMTNIQLGLNRTPPIQAGVPIAPGSNFFLSANAGIMVNTNRSQCSSNLAVASSNTGAKTFAGKALGQQLMKTKMYSRETDLVRDMKKYHGSFVENQSLIVTGKTNDNKLVRIGQFHSPILAAPPQLSRRSATSCDDYKTDRELVEDDVSNTAPTNGVSGEGQPAMEDGGAPDGLDGNIQLVEVKIPNQIGSARLSRPESPYSKTPQSQYYKAKHLGSNRNQSEFDLCIGPSNQEIRIINNNTSRVANGLYTSASKDPGGSIGWTASLRNSQPIDGLQEQLNRQGLNKLQAYHLNRNESLTSRYPPNHQNQLLPLAAGEPILGARQIKMQPKQVGKRKAVGPAKSSDLREPKVLSPHSEGSLKILNRDIGPQIQAHEENLSTAPEKVTVKQTKAGKSPASVEQVQYVIIQQQDSRNNSKEQANRKKNDLRLSSTQCTPNKQKWKVQDKFISPRQSVPSGAAAAQVTKADAFGGPKDMTTFTKRGDGTRRAGNNNKDLSDQVNFTFGDEFSPKAGKQRVKKVSVDNHQALSFGVVGTSSQFNNYAKQSRGIRIDKLAEEAPDKPSTFRTHSSKDCTTPNSKTPKDQTTEETIEEKVGSDELCCSSLYDVQSPTNLNAEELRMGRTQQSGMGMGRQSVNDSVQTKQNHTQERPQSEDEVGHVNLVNRPMSEESKEDVQLQSQEKDIQASVMEDLSPLLLEELGEGPLDPELQSLFTQEYLTDYNQVSNYSSKRINTDIMKKLKMQTMLSKAKRQHNYIYSNLQKTQRGPVDRIREHLKMISDGRDTQNATRPTSKTKSRKVKMAIIGKNDSKGFAPQKTARNQDIRESDQYEPNKTNEWNGNSNSISPTKDSRAQATQAHFQDIQNQIIAKIQDSRSQSPRDSFSINCSQGTMRDKSTTQKQSIKSNQKINKQRLTASQNNPQPIYGNLHPVGNPKASPRFQVSESGSSNVHKDQKSHHCGKDSLEQEEEINQQLKMMENMAADSVSPYPSVMEESPATKRQNGENEKAKTPMLGKDARKKEKHLKKQNLVLYPNQVKINQFENADLNMYSEQHVNLNQDNFAHVSYDYIESLRLPLNMLNKSRGNAVSSQFHSSLHNKGRSSQMTQPLEAGIGSQNSQLNQIQKRAQDAHELSNGSALSNYQSNLRYHHTKRYSQSSEYNSPEPNSRQIQQGRDLKTSSAMILRQNIAKTPITSKPAKQEKLVNKIVNALKNHKNDNLKIDDILETKDKFESPRENQVVYQKKPLLEGPHDRTLGRKPRAADDALGVTGMLPDLINPGLLKVQQINESVGLVAQSQTDFKHYSNILPKNIGKKVHREQNQSRIHADEFERSDNQTDSTLYEAPNFPSRAGFAAQRLNGNHRLHESSQEILQQVKILTEIVKRKKGGKSSKRSSIYNTNVQAFNTQNFSQDLFNNYDNIKQSRTPGQSQEHIEIFCQNNLPEDPSLVRQGHGYQYNKDRLLNFSSDLEYIKNLKRFEKMKIKNIVNISREHRMSGLNHINNIEHQENIYRKIIGKGLMWKESRTKSLNGFKKMDFDADAEIRSKTPSNVRQDEMISPRSFKKDQKNRSQNFNHYYNLPARKRVQAQNMVNSNFDKMQKMAAQHIDTNRYSVSPKFQKYQSNNTQVQGIAPNTSNALEQIQNYKILEQIIHQQRYFDAQIKLNNLGRKAVESQQTFDFIQNHSVIGDQTTRGQTDRYRTDSLPLGTAEPFSHEEGDNTVDISTTSNYHDQSGQGTKRTRNLKITNFNITGTKMVQGFQTFNQSQQSRLIDKSKLVTDSKDSMISHVLSQNTSSDVFTSRETKVQDLKLSVPYALPEATSQEFHRKHKNLLKHLSKDQKLHYLLNLA